MTNNETVWVVAQASTDSQTRIVSVVRGDRESAESVADYVQSWYVLDDAELHDWRDYEHN